MRQVIHVHNFIPHYDFDVPLAFWTRRGEPQKAVFQTQKLASYSENSLAAKALALQSYSLQEHCSHVLKHFEA
jgi:hypothetical protein